MAEMAEKRSNIRVFQRKYSNQGIKSAGNSINLKFSQKENKFIQNFNISRKGGIGLIGMTTTATTASTFNKVVNNDR